MGTSEGSQHLPQFLLSAHHEVETLPPLPFYDILPLHGLRVNRFKDYRLEDLKPGTKRNPFPLWLHLTNILSQQQEN